MVEFLAGAEALTTKDRPVIKPGHAERIAVFDYLVGNADRKPGNWMRRDDEYILIDHDLTFPKETPNGYNAFTWVGEDGFSLSKPPPQPLTTGVKNKLDEMLSGWAAWEEELKKDGLNQKEIDGMKERLDRLVGEPEWPDQTTLFANGSGPHGTNDPSRHSVYVR